MNAKVRGRGAKKIDWILLSLYLGLVALGSLSVYSVSIGDEEVNVGSIWGTEAGRQIMWVSIAAVTMLLIQFISGKFWERFAYGIYGLSILLLLLVPFLGTEIKGATSWFRIGSFGFQPSEVAKFATCLVLASLLNNYRTDLSKSKSLLTAIGFIALPMALILLQPDAGSALIFLSFGVLFYRAGMNPNIILIGFYLVSIFLISIAVNEDASYYVLLGLMTVANILLLSQAKNQFYAIAFGVIITGLSFRYVGGGENLQKFILLTNGILFIILFIYNNLNKRQRLARLVAIALGVSSGIAYSTSYAFNNFLESHQQERINMWLRPDRCEDSGPIYNLIQSKLAIGSGGVKGKGLFEGTLTKLDYVPEQVTDFIFCVIGEEQGFMGSSIMILLFLLFFLRIIYIAERQRSNFSRYYAYGVVGIFFIHFFINIGMTMGLMPIIGIPLPFISKGGSSLLGFTILVAVLLNLDSRRYVL